MPGSLLCRWWHGFLTRCVLDATLDERPSQPLLTVLPYVQRREVMHNDVPTWRTIVGDVWGGQGYEMHRRGRFVFDDTPKKYLMTCVCSLYHRGVNDGTPPTYSHDGTVNWLETAAGQSERAPTSGVWCEISAVNYVIPLSLTHMTGFLLHVECLALVLYQPALGIQDQDPGGTYQPPSPSVSAVGAKYHKGD